MRILAFSDLHRNREAAQAILDAAPAADLVVGAGDFATRGVGLSETVALLCGLAVPTVLVAGNHDDLDALREACRGQPALHVLHGEQVTIRGIPVFGLGYEIPAGNDQPWNRRLEEAEAARLLRPCPEGAILVTHSPPFGVADVQTTGAHEGSHAIRDAVTASGARLLLCGHIHHAWGTSGLIGACPVHNLGPTVNWFSI